MNSAEIGKRIKARRDYLHMSQRALGTAMGITGAGIGHWETGRNAVSLDDLKRLAKVMETDLAYLLGEDDPGSDEPTEEQEGEVLRYFRGVAPTLRPKALAVLRAMMDSEPDYEEGKVYGKKAE